MLAPLVVDETTSYSAVLQRMRELNRGSVMICRGETVTGVFTERDYLHKHCLEGVAGDTPIGKLMSTPPVTVKVKTALGEAIELMHDKKFRNLPIIDDKGRPHGLLTVGAVIRYLAEKFPAEVMNQPPTFQVTKDAEGA